MAEQIHIQQRRQRHKRSEAEPLAEVPVEPNAQSNETSAASEAQADEIDFELSHNDMFWDLQRLLGGLAVDH